MQGEAEAFSYLAYQFGELSHSVNVPWGELRLLVKPKLFQLTGYRQWRVDGELHAESADKLLLTGRYSRLSHRSLGFLASAAPLSLGSTVGADLGLHWRGGAFTGLFSAQAIAPEFKAKNLWSSQRFYQISASPSQLQRGVIPAIEGRYGQTGTTALRLPVVMDAFLEWQGPAGAISSFKNSTPFIKLAHQQVQALGLSSLALGLTSPSYAYWAEYTPTSQLWHLGFRLRGKTPIQWEVDLKVGVTHTGDSALTQGALHLSY